MLDYSLILSNDFKLSITTFCLFETILEILEIFRLQSAAKNISIILNMDWQLYFAKFIATDE